MDTVYFFVALNNFWCLLFTRRLLLAPDILRRQDRAMISLVQINTFYHVLSCYASGRLLDYFSLITLAQPPGLRNVLTLPPESRSRQRA